MLENIHDLGTSTFTSSNIGTILPTIRPSTLALSCFVLSRSTFPSWLRSRVHHHSFPWRINAPQTKHVRSTEDNFGTHSLEHGHYCKQNNDKSYLFFLRWLGLPSHLPLPPTVCCSKDFQQACQMFLRAIQSSPPRGFGCLSPWPPTRVTEPSHFFTFPSFAFTMDQKLPRKSPPFHPHLH